MDGAAAEPVMRLLITGICGFTGRALAAALRERIEDLDICGIDNLTRAGSERNREWLRAQGISFIHGDVRQSSDMELLPDCDWVVDAAAQPSVLAGRDRRTTSRQLLEHNLWGTVEVAEYCRARQAGLILLSTSRVYSIPALADLPLLSQGDSFVLNDRVTLPLGVSAQGVSEWFSTAVPVSLYGSTKLASELLCLEYGQAFGFPVWVNRCGVLAGAGQFGTAEQGIFSYWLHAHAARRRLRYIGFDGTGKQVRDAMHPEDLADLLVAQIRSPQASAQRIYNVGGGIGNSISLARLTAWCDEEFGPNKPESDLEPRPYDVPWLVMDSGAARRQFDWQIKRNLTSILEEIARHVRANPNWLEQCGV